MAAIAPRTYHRREPETTTLYRVVASELDGLRAAVAAGSPYGAGLPQHIDKEIEGYLRCGILAHGFARVACTRCRFEHLVAFSWKGRGICPSCTTRRMHDTAAHLVDRVLPRAPYRQWVATFPRRVRYHLAADPKLATLALREILRVLFAFQRRRARRLGARPARANSNGAVTFVQRFNSALELSLHFHILIPDGVFVRDQPDLDARPRFVEIPPPSHEEVAILLDRIIVRLVRMLRRHGRLDEAIDDQPEPHVLLATRTPKGGERFVEDELPERCARKEGFSLHAGVSVHRNDRASLERLARYGLRPPLAQGRLAESPDGALRYTMKRRFSDGQRTLTFSRREFLLRLCALVPPRGFHMVRYAGMFSAHARGRFALTGRGLHDHPWLPPPSPGGTITGPSEVAAPRPEPATPAAPPARTSKQAVRPAPHDPLATDASPPDPSDLPDDAARSRRMDWARLLQRAYHLDVLVCPRCEGPMRLVALVEDDRIARRILDHLGLPSRPPPRAPPLHDELAPLEAVDPLPTDEF